MLELILAHFAGCFTSHYSSRKVNKDVFSSRTDDTAPANSKVLIDYFTEVQKVKGMFILPNESLKCNIFSSLSLNTKLQASNCSSSKMTPNRFSFLSEIVETDKSFALVGELKISTIITNTHSVNIHSARLLWRGCRAQMWRTDLIKCHTNVTNKLSSPRSCAPIAITVTPLINNPEPCAFMPARPHNLQLWTILISQ